MVQKLKKDLIALAKAHHITHPSNATIQNLVELLESYSITEFKDGISIFSVRGASPKKSPKKSPSKKPLKKIKIIPYYEEEEMISNFDESHRLIQYLYGTQHIGLYELKGGEQVVITFYLADEAKSFDFETDNMISLFQMRYIIHTLEKETNNTQSFINSFFVEKGSHMYFIVIGYQQGDISLGEYIQKNQVINISFLFNFIQRMCLILDTLQFSGISHHNIYPGNIIINSYNGFTTLIGFEYATSGNMKITRKGHYPSPDQKDNDIWDFGYLLYEWVEGKSPFHIKTSDKGPYENNLTQSIIPIQRTLKKKKSKFVNAPFDKIRTMHFSNQKITNIIRSILIPDPEGRPSPYDIDRYSTIGSLPKIGDIIHHYKILATLGGGLTSTVYLAESKNKFYALKLKGYSPSSNREISELTHISKYPKCNEYVSCYYDSFPWEQYYIIITEYIDYPSINSLIGKIEEKNAWSIIRELISGLATIHDHKMAHGDIHGENIMVNSKTNQIKYIDFGFACTREECNQFRVGGITPPEYESIHQYNLDLYQKYDIWCLGKTMYSVFYNQKDPNIQKLIRHMMEENVYKRFSSRQALDFLDELGY